MKVEYRKYSIEIIPENERDEVYLEHVTGLTRKGDFAVAERVAPMGLDHSWAYLRIRKQKNWDRLQMFGYHIVPQG